MKFPDPDWDDPRSADYEPLPGGTQRQNGQDRNYGSVNHPSNTQNTQPQVPEATRPAQQSQQPEAGSSSNAAGDSRPPPTYAEAVTGDHKVQSQS